MKVLFLVRHAKSSWDDPAAEDIDRPLNKKRKSNALEMGERLHSQGIIPGIMISSPARRAMSTARKIAKKINYPREGIRVEKGIYEGSVDALLDIIRNVPGDPGSVLLLDHNPGITGFANSLCGINIHNIPTCGIVSIHFDFAEWKQIDHKKGTLVFFDYPRKSPNAASQSR